MTVEIYVILSICIIGLIYLNKADKKDVIGAQQAQSIREPSAEELACQ